MNHQEHIEVPVTIIDEGRLRQIMLVVFVGSAIAVAIWVVTLIRNEKPFGANNTRRSETRISCACGGQCVRR
jgi:hypothetical protein